MAWVVPHLAQPVPESAKLLQGEISWKGHKGKAKPCSSCSIKFPCRARRAGCPSPPDTAALFLRAVSEGQTLTPQPEPLLPYLGQCRFPQSPKKHRVKFSCSCKGASKALLSCLEEELLSQECLPLSPLTGYLPPHPSLMRKTDLLHFARGLFFAGLSQAGAAAWTKAPQTGTDK